MQPSGAASGSRNRHCRSPPPTIRRPMRTENFWAIVQRSSRGRQDEAGALVSLTNELQRLGERAIGEFEHHVQQQLCSLDLSEIRDVATQLWVLSDEAWLHFRAWCISQGREFVDRLTAEPGRVLRQVAASRGGPFDPPNGEIFLYCGEYARIARTKAVA